MDAAPSVDGDPRDRAAFLLGAIRATRMAFTRLGASKQHLLDRIATALTDCDIPPQLATRIARQLVLKCDLAHLESPATWRAVGNSLRAEVACLRQLGLVDR